MTEPTIICPNCKTEIKLTESLAAPLIESTRKQYEQQLAQKENDIATREQAAREKWIEATGAIGIAKAGRGGVTYAHKDIAEKTTSCLEPKESVHFA